MVNVLETALAMVPEMNATRFPSQSTMLSKVREVIESNVSTDVRGDHWVDATAAAMQILQLYEGDRWEDVRRGGQSVAMVPK
jgi:hypothetical protein